MNLQIRKVHESATIPTRAHATDAGLDFYAIEQTTINADRWAKVRTGIAIALPAGTVGLVHSRSGQGAKHGISLINGVGVIDEDYRGEILAHVHNNGRRPYTIEKGERFLQMVIQQYETPTIQLVDQLPPTERGLQGHGSTGL